MTKGIKRTFVWKLLISREYKSGWTSYTGQGISKSKTKCHNAGKDHKLKANVKERFKVVKVTSKGYSSPYETL